MWKQTTKWPAWTSLSKTSEVRLEPASEEESIAFKKNGFEESQIVERVYFDDRFLNRWKVGNELVSWSPPDDFDFETEVFQLAQWLFEKGVNTPKPTRSPKRVSSTMDVWKNGFLKAVEFVNYEPIVPTDDMTKLGDSILRTHFFLAKHPGIEIWKKNTDKRISYLVDIRKLISTKDFKCSPFPGLLEKLAKDQNLDFKCSSEKRTPLHGDLNGGNAFVNEKDEVHLIDFEDVHHSVLPIKFEIAFAIERFLFIQDLDENDKVLLAQNFINQFTLEKTDWLNTIKSLNLRSLCVSAAIEAQGGNVTKDEWSKFFELMQAAEKSDFWRRLS